MSRAKAAMIRDMENAVERLTDESSMVSPENDVKKINILLEKLINCLPGNVKIKRKELPPLPSYNRKVETHNGNEEFSSLFINLASHIDRDFASIHDLINGIFLSGWQKARLSLNKIQDQLREDELNQLVRSFAAEISKINNKQEIIQAQVTTNTWQTYNQLNQRVQLALQSL